MKAHTKTILLLFLAGNAGSALAAKNSLSEADYFPELPMVLSASRLPQSLHDAPGSMTVIDRETIKRTGARDLADVLRWVPGFQVAQGTGYTNAPAATYHGLWTRASTGLQVMVDGRSYYSPLWYGGLFFDAFPLSLENVERIEIFRGANSATFGSNAMAGIINIITTEPVLTQGAMVSVNAGNQGVADVFTRIGGGNDQIKYRLSANRQHDHGLNWFSDSRALNKFDARVDWRLTNHDEIRFMASGVKTAVQMGHPAPLVAGAEPERGRKISSLHFQTDWKHQLSGDDTISLRYFHVKESLRDAFIDQTPLPRTLIDPLATGNIAFLIGTDIAVVRDDLELQHNVRLDATKRLVWGLNWRRDDLTSVTQLIAPNQIKVTTSRVFGHLEWRWSEQWLLNTGATWENESQAGTSFSPRLALNFQPTRQQTFRFGVSRSHRTPSIAEQNMKMVLNDPAMPAFAPLRYAYFSDDNLRPERLDSLEIAYLGDFRPQGLVVDARLFHDRMSDRVSHVRNKPLPANACSFCALPGGNLTQTYRNAQDVTLQGLEYQLRWRTPWSSEIWFNQTFARIKSKRILVDLPPGEADLLVLRSENSMPSRAESIHWMQELPWRGANLTVSFSHSKPMLWWDAPALSTRRVDWRLALPFNNSFGKGEIAWVARAGNGPIEEYSNGAQRFQQYTINPRHWINLRLEF
ncbi:MAG: putative TonB-dependent receptor [Proteobacteria bacterium]|nr:putative TonB-dependent receptor [Pseudomonadota bacterium]